MPQQFEQDFVRLTEPLRNTIEVYVGFYANPKISRPLESGAPGVATANVGGTAREACK